MCTIDSGRIGSIRLVGWEKQTHRRWAEQMGRSCFVMTEIYESARYKLADTLVNGNCQRFSRLPLNQGRKSLTD